jgi:hypothetical protein
MSIRRISNIFSTIEGKKLRSHFKNTPKISLPILLLSPIDLGTLIYLFDKPPQFIFLNVERKRAVRVYELMSTSNSIRFFYELGESAYAFKRFLRDLAFVTSIKELYSRAIQVLLDISLAINFRCPDKLLNALYRAIDIRNEPRIKHPIYIPNRDELARAVHVLS